MCVACTSTRRDFCAITGTTVASFLLGTACRQGDGSDIANDGRLTARPHGGVETSAKGRIMLDLDRERDAILELPKTGGPSPLPVLVLLHGMLWVAASVPAKVI